MTYPAGSNTRNILPTLIKNKKKNNNLKQNPSKFFKKALLIDDTKNLKVKPLYIDLTQSNDMYF